MKKAIFSSIVLFFLVILVTFNMYKAKDKISKYINVSKNISKIMLLNKDFNLYLNKQVTYDNFDKLNANIEKFNFFNAQLNLSKTIKEDKNLQNIIKDFNKKTQIKINYLEKFKAHRAILNNSLKIIYGISKKSFDDKLNNLYIDILSLNSNYINDRNLLINKIKINKNKYLVKEEQYFLLHEMIVLEYNQKISSLKNKIINLHLDKTINTIKKDYEIIAKHEISIIQNYILVLVILLFILIILYLIYQFKLNKSYEYVQRFKSSIEDGDNMILITDKNEKIKYVNNTFCKITGYTLNEVIGKSPGFLSAYDNQNKKYSEIKNNIYNGKTWSGDFINRKKDGSIFYEKASITPILDKNNKIIEFIAVKLDISNEILTKQKLFEREKLLLEQSKLSAMGEMIGNIAHQWRQPLSVISTGATAMNMKASMNMIDNEYIIKTSTFINENAQYLSKTIDDFRTFIKGDKQKEYFNLSKNMDKFLNLINPLIQDNNIKLNIDFDDSIKLNSYANELNQCLINIVNNSKDALVEKDLDIKCIFISTKKIQDNIIINIQDNAEGIPKEVLPKIFEPYFTTKHKSKGTGLGLSMTYSIINENFNGTIEVENIQYNYEDKEMKGAKFTITLPIQ